MNCPKCGFGYSSVIETRSAGIAKRRRRECAGCGLRYTSYELIDLDYEKLIIDREKLKQAIKIMEGI